MAYTILRTDNSTLTTIQDGTLNTTRTSLGLPGRNFAGYGNVIDTNFVRLLENFANDSSPQNPIKGQLWFDTNSSKMKVCKRDGSSDPTDWLVLTASNSLGNSQIGNLEVTDSIIANTISSNASVIVGTDLTVLGNASINANITATLANVATANIGTTYTKLISTGNPGTAGNLVGSWTVNGSSSGNALSITSGNIAMGGTLSIRCNNYLDSNGDPWIPSGTYTNANVAEYLAGTGNVSSQNKFAGNIYPGNLITTNITTGSSATAGNITGNWSLTQNSKLLATYSADIAERYAADGVYTVGTVVELGGDYEVTLAKTDLSSEIFGVVSNTYAHLLNSAAGTDETHPPIALTGRVAVRVIGQVAKGQRLVSAGNGLARAGKLDELTAFNVVGRSLVNKTDDGEGIIEAAVSIR